MQTIVCWRQWINRIWVFNSTIKKCPVAFITLIRLEPKVLITQETSQITIIIIIIIIMNKLIIALVLTRTIT